MRTYLRKFQNLRELWKLKEAFVQLQIKIKVYLKAFWAFGDKLNVTKFLKLLYDFLIQQKALKSFQKLFKFKELFKIPLN